MGPSAHSHRCASLTRVAFTLTAWAKLQASFCSSRQTFVHSSVKGWHTVFIVPVCDLATHLAPLATALFFNHFISKIILPQGSLSETDFPVLQSPSPWCKGHLSGVSVVLRESIPSHSFKATTLKLFSNLDISPHLRFSTQLATHHQYFHLH